MPAPAPPPKPPLPPPPKKPPLPPASEAPKTASTGGPPIIPSAGKTYSTPKTDYGHRTATLSSGGGGSKNTNMFEGIPPEQEGSKPPDAASIERMNKQIQKRAEKAFKAGKTEIGVRRSSFKKGTESKTEDRVEATRKSGEKKRGMKADQLRNRDSPKKQATGTAPLFSGSSDNNNDMGPIFSGSSDNNNDMGDSL